MQNLNKFLLRENLNSCLENGVAFAIAFKRENEISNACGLQPVYVSSLGLSDMENNNESEFKSVIIECFIQNKPNLTLLFSSQWNKL